jgi:cleavage stimulation factor subunit 3
MVDDRSREFLSVRRIAKEYENVTRQLDKNAPSIPPVGSMDELKQLNAWKKYIEWEKSNPLKYEDQSLVAKRGMRKALTRIFFSRNCVLYVIFLKLIVMFAYEQCLLSLGYHPDIWYEAASYLHQMSVSLADKGNIALSKQYADEVGNLYERATGTSMKTNFLIHFSHADFEEVSIDSGLLTIEPPNLIHILNLLPRVGPTTKKSRKSTITFSKKKKSIPHW